MNAPIVDNTIIMIEEVTQKQYQGFYDELQRQDALCMIPKLKSWIGTRAKDYHYNLRIGEGEGAVFIGWKHNSSKLNRGGYKLKLEFNPSKIGSKAKVFDLIRFHFRSNTRLVTSLDFAWDIPIHKASIIVLPVTGREENRDRGTRYWGERGNGFLKVYDKKAERESRGYEVPEEFLTRVEYSWKDSKGCSLDSLKYADICPGLFYNIKLYGEQAGTVKPSIMACINSLRHGQFQLKNFTRSEQRDIDKALVGSRQLALDESVQEHIEKVANSLMQYIDAPIKSHHAADSNISLIVNAM